MDEFRREWIHGYQWLPTQKADDPRNEEDADDGHLNKLEQDKNNDIDNQSHYLSLQMNKIRTIS